MRYTPESREQVRDAVDFVELVKARTELRSGGPRRLIGRCPFHDERTPSFGIDPVEKLYHCFGCGAGGDLFQFVMETEGLDFTGALEMLADRTGVRLEPVSEDPQQVVRRERRSRLLGLMERTTEYYVRMFWESTEAKDAREYLASRGLKDEVLRTFRVGYAPSAWDRIVVGSQQAGFTLNELTAAGLVVKGRSGGLYDRFRGRIIFPLADVKGAIIGFGARALRDNQQPKYLNSPESELFHKGRALYAADHARVAAAKLGEIIVAEGYTDVISMHQAGFSNTVGVMGTAFTDEQANELARLAPSIALCLDADTAGREAISRAAQLLAKRRRALRVVPLPNNLDPAELIAQSGAEAMQSLLSGTVPFERFEVGRILDGGDLNTAVGRDEVLSLVAAIIRPLSPSVLRDELVQLVASRLGLGESLVVATLGSVAPRRSQGEVLSGNSYSQRQAVGAGAVLNRRELTERSLLALCIAQPEEGQQYLNRVDLDRLFASPLSRQAAHYLSGRLANPGSGLADEQAELTNLVAELVVRAGQVDHSTETLELEGLQLELAQIDSDIALARAEGHDSHGLVVERGRVQGEIRKRLQ